MTSRTRRSPIVYALWLNGTLGVLCIAALVVQWTSKPAVADMPKLAGGAGFYLATAQLSDKDFGAFTFDNGRQVLSVYSFVAPEPPAKKELRFVASRAIDGDLELTDFGTSPSPMKVRQKVEAAAASGLPILPSDLED